MFSQKTPGEGNLKGKEQELWCMNGTHWQRGSSVEVMDTGEGE